MILEDAEKKIAEAEAASTAAGDALEAVQMRHASLAAELSAEKANLKQAEAEAITARAAGKAVKGGVLDNLRGNIRITEEALARVGNEVAASRSAYEAAGSAAEAARGRLARLRNDLFFIEAVGLIADLVDHIEENVDSHEHRRVIAGALMYWEGQMKGNSALAIKKAAADKLFGTGSEARSQLGFGVFDAGSVSLPALGQPRKQLLDLIAERGGIWF